MYADDTTLSLRGTSAPELFDNCNQQLNFFINWATSNRLTINAEKTFYMVITNLNIQNNLPNLIISTNLLQLKKEEKILGVVLDEGLKFKGHISLLCRKVSRSIGILYKLRNYLPLSSLIQLYYTFIYPHFIYCNLIWGNTFESHLKPLIILQKKVIRIINHANFNCHTNDLFHRNEILKLKDISFFLQGVHMYKTDHISFQQTHSYNTRNRSHLIPTFQRTVLTQRSLLYSAPNVWNQIPTEIKTLPTLPKFKRTLKAYLINKYVGQVYSTAS